MLPVHEFAQFISDSVKVMIYNDAILELGIH